MTKKEFKDELKKTILTFGYWSEEVKELNTKGQTLFGYVSWHRLHNKVKSEIK